MADLLTDRLIRGTTHADCSSMVAVAPLFFLFFGTRDDHVRGGINHEACRVHESESFLRPYSSYHAFRCLTSLAVLEAVPTVPFPRVSDAEHDVRL
jgi:hypothetical protein